MSGDTNITKISTMPSMEILRAIEKDDLANFKSITQKYLISYNSRIQINLPNVNKYIADGPQLIAVAAFFQAATIFDFLLKQGVSIQTLNGAKPVLHYAITGMHNGIIQTLLSCPDIDTTNLFLPALHNGFVSLSRFFHQLLKQEHPEESNTSILNSLINKNPLKAAIRSGDVDTFKFIMGLLEEDFPGDDDESMQRIVIVDSEKQSTALHAATLKMHTNDGHKNIIPLLVEKYPQQLEMKDSQGRTPLVKSLIGWVKMQYNTSSLIIIDEILKVYKTPEDICRILSEPDNKKMTPLHYAAKFGNYTVFERLMSIFKEYPQYINLVDNFNRTAIYYGVLNCNIEILNLFVSLTPSIQESLSIPDSRGLLPIHLAAKSDWDEGFSILLQACPSEDMLLQVDSSGMSAMMWAAVNGSEKVILSLISNQYFESLHLDTRRLICQDRVSQTKRSILHWLCLEGHYNLIKIILEEHIFDDLNILSEEPKVTPLFFAAKKGYVEICKLLLENGAHPAFPNKGRIPKEVARTEEIKKLLIEWEHKG